MATLTPVMRILLVLNYNSIVVISSIKQTTVQGIRLCGAFGVHIS